MKRALFLTVAVFIPAGASAADRIQSQTGFTDPGNLLEAIFKLLIFFLPTIAAIYVAVSGYRYMAAQGNPELVEKAKKSLLYAVFGFVVALVSVAIIALVSEQLGFNITP